MNAYWEMPFRKSARYPHLRILAIKRCIFYYQIDYTLTVVPDDAAYFHAQWRRSNPLPYKEVHTLVDSIKGKGQYVGTYLAWQSNSVAGGARARLSFIWMAIATFRPFAEPEQKIISAGPGILSNQMDSMVPIQRPFSVCPRSFNPMASTRVSSDLACIAGISWTRSVLQKICMSRSRRWAGEVGGAISPCKTTLPLSPSGTRLSHTRPTQPSLTPTPWRSLAATCEIFLQFGEDNPLAASLSRTPFREARESLGEADGDKPVPTCYFGR